MSGTPCFQHDSYSPDCPDCWHDEPMTNSLSAPNEELIAWLRRVPKSAILVVDEGPFDTTFPIGEMVHDAADRLEANRISDARVTELREALEPFADFGDDDEHWTDNGMVACRHGAMTFYLEWGNFRRARAALAKQEPR